jgi:hypothetical protein
VRHILPGWKTNITTILLALIPIAGLFGYELDPAAVSQFVDEFGGWIQSGLGLLGAAGVWFRQLGKRDVPRGFHR